jgi:hypothetical protein
MRSNLFLTTPICAALIFLFCLQSAQAREPREKGIWCKQELKHQFASEHKKLIVGSLRRITGFEQLDFASNGAMYLGENTSSATGSQTARNILQQVIDAGSEIIIEDHSHSPLVNFGQLDNGTNYEDLANHKRFTIWRVRIDFDDFRAMQSSREVREAFDPGITLLHEFLHSLGHKDPTHFGDIGECETLINQVRAELGMPLREHYHGVPLMQLSHQAVIVRMKFRERIEATVSKMTTPARWKIHYLFFVMTMNDETSSALVGLRK